MKGLMVPALVLTLTGMVMGQATQFPTEPIAYSLPVSDSIIESLKVEGWRQADIEVGVEEWIWQIVLRNPELGTQPRPVELNGHAGIRSGKIHFLVNDQQLELIHQQGLIYHLKPEERGQFKKVVLIYESEFATVPMSSELASLHLPSPPSTINLPAPPNSRLGTPPVDFTSRTSNATALENIARTHPPSYSDQTGPNGLGNAVAGGVANQTTTFIEQWSGDNADTNPNGFRAQVREQSPAVLSQSETVTSQAQLQILAQANQAEAARLAQMRVELDQERYAFKNQKTDENRPAINYPTNQYPNRYANADSQQYVDSSGDRYGSDPANVGLHSNRGNRVRPTLVDHGSTDAPQIATTMAEETNADSSTKSSGFFLWLMLLAAIGLNVYLGLIARSFYMRYGELARELRETFSSSI